MSLSIPDFWRLLAESQLLPVEQCRQWHAAFAKSKTARSLGDKVTTQNVAEWLVGKNVLSKYQATILLAGRSGPFLYGDYLVYDRVDRGRLGGQFRAVHRPTGHPVLLQFLADPSAQDPAIWNAIASDTVATSAIVSPYLQRYFEPVDLSTLKLLVGEDLRGNSADQLLASGRVSPTEACRLVRTAALGLVSLHQAGRVHGDIRPAQIWIEPSTPPQPGAVKLLVEPHVPIEPIPWNSPADAGRIAILADYMAPELCQPGRVPDVLTDVYALGCTLYALLTGNPPFAGGSLQQKLHCHAAEPIRPLEAFGVPPQLATLVAYMMAKNPQVRLQAASIVAEQLTPFVDPSTLYIQPAAPPESLASFETFIRQKQAALVQQQSAVTAAPFQLSGSGSSDAEGSGPVIGVSASTKSSTITRRKKSQMPLFVGGGVALVALLGLLVWFLNSGGEAVKPEENPIASAPPEVVPETSSTPEVPTTPATNTTPGKEVIASTPGGKTAGEKGNATKSPAGEEAVALEVVPDDGQTLWSSPTTGGPVSFRCVPPVGQIFVIARPADLMASPEGPKTLQALGPQFQSTLKSWESSVGLPLEEIQQVIVSFHNNDAKFPRVSVVVETKAPFEKDDLLAKWGNPAEAKEEDHKLYNGASWSYFIPSGDDAKNRFVMGEQVDVREVAKVNGAPPVLFREIEKLRRSTDDKRHLTILFNPAFFFNDDGQPLLTNEREKLREPLSWFFGDDLKGGLFSLHLSDPTYVELRFLASLNKEKFQLAGDFRERLKQVPNNLTDYLARITPLQYWNRLWFKYPTMISKLNSNMRVGVENDEAVINTILPPSATHNLVLGGELLIAASPGAAIATVATSDKQLPKTLDEVLTMKTSFSFAQQSLEFAMRDLGNEVSDTIKGAPVEFSIKILGDDLQLDGITRNQSIRDFAQNDKTVGEIITALVMRANPITTVKTPDELDQKLIWVIGTDPDNASKKLILITTRQQAAKKSYTLPDTFKPKEGKDEKASKDKS